MTNSLVNKNIRSVFLSRKYPDAIDRVVKELPVFYPSLKNIKILDSKDTRNIFNDRDFVKIVFNVTVSSTKFIEVASKQKWHIFLSDTNSSVVTSSFYIHGADDITIALKKTIQEEQSDIDDLELTKSIKSETVKRHSEALETMDEIIKQRVLNNQLSIDSLVQENNQYKDSIFMLENKLSETNATLSKYRVELMQYKTQISTSNEVIEAKQTYIQSLQCTITNLNCDISNLNEMYNKLVTKDSKKIKQKLINKNLDEFIFTLQEENISLRKLLRMYEAIVKTWTKKTKIDRAVLSMFVLSANITLESFNKKHKALHCHSYDFSNISHCQELFMVLNKQLNLVNDLIQLYLLLKQAKKVVKDKIQQALEE